MDIKMPTRPAQLKTNFLFSRFVFVILLGLSIFICIEIIVTTFRISKESSIFTILYFVFMIILISVLAIDAKEKKSSKEIRQMLEIRSSIHHKIIIYMIFILIVQFFFVTVPLLKNLKSNCPQSIYGNQIQLYKAEKFRVPLLTPDNQQQFEISVGNPPFFLADSIDYFFNKLPQNIWGYNLPPGRQTSLEQEFETKMADRKTSFIENIFSFVEKLYWIKWISVFILIFPSAQLIYGIYLMLKNRRNIVIYLGYIATEFYIVALVFVILSGIIFFLAFGPHAIIFDNSFNNSFYLCINQGDKIEIPSYSYMKLHYFGIGKKRIQIYYTDRNELKESECIWIRLRIIDPYLVYNIGEKNSYRIRSAYYDLKRPQ